MRLFRRLLFQIVLWSVLPLIAITVVSVISIYGHQQAERELVADRATRLARITAARLSDDLADRMRVLQTLADAEAVHPDDFAAQQQALERAQEVRELFDHGVALFDSTGATVARSENANGWLAQPIVAELKAQVAATNRPAFSPTFPDPISGEQLTLLAVPVPFQGRANTSSIQAGGLLVAAFAAAHMGLDEMLADLQLGSRGVGYVVDGQGRVIFHPQPPQIGQDARDLPGVAQLTPNQDDVVSTQRAGSEHEESAGSLFYTDAQGEQWAVGYAPTAAARWGVIVQEPWSEVVSPMIQFSVLSPALVILAALVSLAAAYVTVRYVIRPLGLLGRVAGRVAWGDFAAADTPVDGVQEIRDLHSTLKHMADQLRRRQAGLQNYVAAVTQGQEDERRRLARELHDDTAQALVGLIQRIKLALRDLERNPARAAQRLSELETLATSAWQDVRRFSEDLRPSSLEELGLEPALMTLADQAQERGGPQIAFSVSGAARRLSRDLELTVFRVVQEALSNVRQHAQAEHAQVSLQFGDDGLTVSIQDDGTGFEPPERPTGLARQGHLGLAGMRERVLLVGGRLSIDSAPGRGTRVEVCVPYGDQDAGTGRSPL